MDIFIVAARLLLAAFLEAIIGIEREIKKGQQALGLISLLVWVLVLLCLLK